MKRIFLLLLLAVNGVVLYAQDSLINLDVLRAPSSPAASLIGTSPSEVHSFTDPSAFMVSLQNATDNFSSLPKNYAVDIAPAWLFNAKNISYKAFASDKIKYTLPQSFIISTAVSQVGDSTDVGVSIKFSLFRGKFGNEHINGIDTVLDFLTIAAMGKDKYFNHFDSLARKNIIIADMVRKGVNESIVNKFSDSLNTEREKSYNAIVAKTPEMQKHYDTLKKIASRISLKRYGFKMDFAAGMAYDFPSQVYDSGYMAKAGAWLTAGWEMESGVSIEGLGRYLYHPDKIFADDKGVLKTDDISTFDAGGRLQYENLQYRLTIGAEVIYRSAIGHDLNSWRYIINADYVVQKNTHLTLSIGKDYAGTVTKDGTLITALNLLFGLGNGKKLK